MKHNRATSALVAIAALSATLIANSAAAYVICNTVNGVNWCYNDNACGEACDDVCAAAGTTPIASDTDWIMAQDTAAECTAIATAFGIGSITLGAWANACLEDDLGPHTAPGGLFGTLYCSTYAACASAHRTIMDHQGIACGGASRRSICPCNIVASCGNGVIDSGDGEQCDDGNTVDGDCCSSSCQFESSSVTCRASVDACDVAENCTGSSGSCPTDAKQISGTACDDATVCNGAETCDGAGTCLPGMPLNCDDGNGCTGDSCEPLGGCVHDNSPATGCLTSESSMVLIKSNADNVAKDKLLWKWIKGADLSQMTLANPISGAVYALCVYSGSSNALIADATIPPGPGWSGIGTTGYKFKGTSPRGLSLALLKGGSVGKSKALAKGKGYALPDPTLPLAYPVTVQLRKDGSALCLESTFTAANEVKNDARQFKAKK